MMYDHISHFHLQTEVTTVICGQKELNKLLGISGQLKTVKNVICMDEIPQSLLNSEPKGDWKITSFAKVQLLGQESNVGAELPISADIAVIMYTSGSTGLPKVRNFYLCTLALVYTHAHVHLHTHTHLFTHN